MLLYPSERSLLCFYILLEAIVVSKCCPMVECVRKELFLLVQSCVVELGKTR